MLLTPKVRECLTAFVDQLLIGSRYLGEDCGLEQHAAMFASNRGERSTDILLYLCKLVRQKTKDLFTVMFAEPSCFATCNSGSMLLALVPTGQGVGSVDARLFELSGLPHGSCFRERSLLTRGHQADVELLRYLRKQLQAAVWGNVLRQLSGEARLYLAYVFGLFVEHLDEEFHAAVKSCTDTATLQSALEVLRVHSPIAL